MPRETKTKYRRRKKLEAFDAFIAEKVMGLKVIRKEYSNGIGYMTPAPIKGQWGGDMMPIPEYSRDIAAAWPLFDNLGPAWQISQSDPGGYGDNQRWWCWLPEEYGGDGMVYMAKTAPLAICKAALDMAKKEVA